MTILGLSSLSSSPLCLCSQYYCDSRVSFDHFIKTSFYFLVVFALGSHAASSLQHRTCSRSRKLGTSSREHAYWHLRNYMVGFPSLHYKSFLPVFITGYLRRCMFEGTLCPHVILFSVTLLPCIIHWHEETLILLFCHYLPQVKSILLERFITVQKVTSCDLLCPEDVLRLQLRVHNCMQWI